MRLLPRSAVVVAAVAFVMAVTACGASQPPRLTAYGQIVWNLDALLHDTFGSHQVWQDYPRDSAVSNYSTKFISDASSIPYVYTFATARNSDFKAVRPKHPPRVGTYATGYNAPVRVRGAYVSCGNGKWLYERNGQAVVDGNMWCSHGPLAP